MKKFLSLIIAITMLTSMMLNVSAINIDDGNTISPCWDYMSGITVNLSFYDTGGLATASISRIKNVTTLLEGTLTVYEKVGSRWVEVDSVSDSSTRTLSLSLEFDAESGKTYKAEVEVTAYGTDGSESDSNSKTKTCP